ncbi:amidohydrolase family protein [Naumannella halotolerans]|uniref:Imidazolonepropionase-like amidohydrolase n=1 Tax=Naumannella halotolerans TaxID=993414 RepID=A0A4R7J6K0_9ACTN|nr:amidohydrolase family protein [Naumannella halotolerans]TDT33021.1 imidazolonepropionase-like amidohydrolase [Naumannella halotolerans]
MESLHLHGTWLPSGEVADRWVVDGVMTDEPQTGATTVCRDGYLMPGLVDAHCHIGLGAEGEVSVEEAESQAIVDRNSGVLLVRDAGVPEDTRWVQQRADLPRTIRCGRHIARPKRYIRGFAAEVEPEGLLAEVEKQALDSDGWIKLVGDWIDRGVGDLAPLWPTEVLAPAVDRAHELGVRVAAHVFGEEAVAQLVEVGVDCIEHGSGLTDEVIAQMVHKAIALDPTLVQIENFPDFAAQGEAKFPTYAKHMRDLHRRRFETVGKAYDAGVQIYAGSDAGGLRPHGTLAMEIELLARVGGAEFALGAASWRAREWLGAAQLAAGEPADLVVYDSDPRDRVGVVAHPSAVILRGVPVA